MDFNAIKKIIFNTRLIPALEVQNSILRELIGERCRQSIIYVAINKKLLVNISNQIKRPHTTISANTSNCFD